MAAASRACVFYSAAKYAFSRPLLSAVTFHLNHLRIARALGDSAGEVRANSSLANDFLRLNEYRKALYYLVRNYTLAKKVGSNYDELGERVKCRVFLACTRLPSSTMAIMR